MTTTTNPVASAPMYPVVGQPMYAVFGRHVSRGIAQMSIPLTLDEAKRFMKFSKCYMFFTKRRIRRLPNTVIHPATKFDIAWTTKGMFKEVGAHELDIVKILSTKSQKKPMIPARNTKEFTTYACRVMSSDKPIAVATKGTTTYTYVLNSDWNWEKYDYVIAAEVKAYEWYDYKRVKPLIGKPLLLREVAKPKVVLSALLWVGGDEVKFEITTGCIEETNYLEDNKPVYEISTDLGKTWKELGVKL